MAKKAPAIPLKDIMAALDKRDRGFYNRLSPEQKKAFSAWMMMRYASSVQGKDAAHYIYMTNELVNKDFSEVSKHPELQWLLLSAAGVGKIQFHPYLKPPNSKKKKDKVRTMLSEIYPHMKHDEIEILFTINTKDELKEFAKDHGHDDKSIKDIFGK
jgi:hypothetical protein|tara:strand:+ start:886 stop:1356 length:471 start_codon:yes stop_codon:yes gene_type:complete